MVTDPISDFLIRLQNASRVHKAHVSVPASKMKHAVALMLAREGYIGDIDAKSDSLKISLLYPSGKPAINGVRRLSKPSRRVYMGVRDVKPVKRGHGLLVLSTPSGILTGYEAKTKRVGGEVLFEIW